MSKLPSKLIVFEPDDLIKHMSDTAGIHIRSTITKIEKANGIKTYTVINNNKPYAIEVQRLIAKREKQIAKLLMKQHKRGKY